MIYSFLRNALSAERAAPCEGEECEGTVLKKAEEIGLTDFVKYVDEAKLATDLSKPGESLEFLGSRTLFEVGVHSFWKLFFDITM